MITIAVHFPAGRYHATPWGSHVNEGLVEWPPNPWRLMRALIATGFAKLHWEEIPDDARSLIEKLAGSFPEFQMPVGQLAHTRHYMPSGGFHTKQKNLETTDKVLDTFVRLHPEDPLLIRWPVGLTKSEAEQLDLLLQNVSYLGRAESWVDMSLISVSPAHDRGWTSPSQGEAPPLNGDQVALLVAIEQSKYEAWRKNSLQQSLEIEQQRRGKKLTKTQRANIEDKFPVDLVGCLTMDTSAQQKHGWSQPPGSTRVLYNRVNTLAPLSQVRTHRRSTRTVEAALLSLSSDSVRGDRLPRMTRAIRQGEFIHQSLVSILNNQGIRDCSVLTGRTESGKKLGSVHTHAHYFPLDLDDNGRIDHVLIYAPGGLDETARRAITRLRRTWTKGGDTTIFVTCSGFGDLDLFRQQLRHDDGRPVAIIPREPSSVWTSVTPYVPARHLKPKNNRYTINDDVRREFEHRGVQPPDRIELFSKDELVDSQFLKYARKRIDGKPQPPQPLVYGLKLHLSEPFPGPIAIGYGSHFGLGLFVAELGNSLSRQLEG